MGCQEYRRVSLKDVSDCMFIGYMHFIREDVVRPITPILWVSKPHLLYLLLSSFHKLLLRCRD